MACFNLRRGSLQNDVVRSVHFQLNSTCSTECSWFWYQVTDCHISHQGLSPRISLHLEAIFLAWILTRFFSCFRAFAGGSICPFSGQALVSKNHWMWDSSTIYPYSSVAPMEGMPGLPRPPKDDLLRKAWPSSMFSSLSRPCSPNSFLSGCSWCTCWSPKVSTAKCSGPICCQCSCSALSYLEPVGRTTCLKLKETHRLWSSAFGTWCCYFERTFLLQVALKKMAVDWEAHKSHDVSCQYGEI